MSSARLMSIDKELRRCLIELNSTKTAKTNMSSELRKLEAEIFGPDKSKICSLGVRYPNDRLGTVSYRVHGDADLSGGMENYVSCQSGGMYGMNVAKDVRFHRSVYKVTRNGKEYDFVAYRTNNKENKLEVCAMAVFRENRFLAYLFSTNDPLSFDNFNCFHGRAPHASEKPQLECVEQLVFCKNKVAINMKCLEKCGSENLFRVAMSNERLEHGPLVKILKEIGIDLESEINDLKREFTLEGELSKENEGKFKIKALEVVRREIENLGHAKFHVAYRCYFLSALIKPHDKLPLNEYKMIGRSLIPVGDYLDIFDSFGLLCVMSARMHQLHQSPFERYLTSAMVPRCVAECSKDDNLWGYMMVRTFKKEMQKKLDGMVHIDTDGNDRGIPKADEDRLFEIIEHATRFQDGYINKLSGLLENNQVDSAIKMLFDTCKDSFIKDFVDKPDTEDPSYKTLIMDFSAHKLGLSERLLQALWTKQIVFPPELIHRITQRMAEYGVQYFHYVPELVQADPAELSPHKIAMKIGVAA